MNVATDEIKTVEIDPVHAGWKPHPQLSRAWIMPDGKVFRFPPSPAREVLIVPLWPMTLQYGRASAEGWRPIASAPKDRFIFLWCPEDGSRWLAKWQDSRWFGVDDQGLSRCGMGPEDVTGWAVTHWMPLPEPPSVNRD